MRGGILFTPPRCFLAPTARITMVDPKLMEAWYRLMAEAVRTGNDMSASMPKGEGPPVEWLANWMRDHDLPGAPPTPNEVSDDWLEQWYQMMGVVPRRRYLKVLDRNEQLRQQLEEANRRIERLGGAAATSQNQGKAAEEMFDYWKQSMEDTLNAQKRWMRSLGQDQNQDQKKQAKDDTSDADSSGSASGDASDD